MTKSKLGELKWVISMHSDAKDEKTEVKRTGLEDSGMPLLWAQVHQFSSHRVPFWQFSLEAAPWGEAR